MLVQSLWFQKLLDFWLKFSDRHCDCEYCDSAGRSHMIIGIAFSESYRIEALVSLARRTRLRFESCLGTGSAGCRIQAGIAPGQFQSAHRHLVHRARIYHYQAHAGDCNSHTDAAAAASRCWA